MSGASDYAAYAFARWITGQRVMPPPPEIWMAMFSSLPSDGNLGGVELSGNGYARAQVAGQVTTTLDALSGETVLAFASIPSWIVVGMSVGGAGDETPFQSNQTVSAIDTANNTITVLPPLDAPLLTGEIVAFSAFGPPSGSDPSLVLNAVDIFFPSTQGTGWGTMNGWGFFDDPVGGSLLVADVVVGGSQVIGGPGLQPRFAAGQLALKVI